MAARFTCGDAMRLEALLDDDLPPDEQAELAAHLETCETCRRTFDALAGGSRWLGDLREYACSAPTPEPGQTPTLPMEGIRDGRADEPTQAGPTARDEGLDFLGPPATPGHLGRFGPYEVTELLGRGGMGVVLKAFDPALHRLVAVKVLAPQLATSATARKRFLREARAAASVVHEHVVTIHAVDEVGGLPFLVMPYVPGKSLQERIDAAGPLELNEILRIGMQTASGLAAAHAQGLVHRDVKPANIRLENGVERVKLTDFGLARAADDASLTQSGMVAGTPQYMAPEQARGEPVDHRADLFSLGTVLYAMCTGRSPFRAETTVAVLRRVCEDTPRPVRELNPEIPDWLEAMIAKLHAKDPADRFQSASEVAVRLGRHLALLQQPSHVGYAVPDDPEIPPAKTPSRVVGRRRTVPAAALLLLALFGGLALAEGTGVTKVSGLLATVLRIPMGDGTLVVEVDDPDVRVEVDGDAISLRGTGAREVRLHPGAHQVRATRGGVPVLTELVTISRGGKRTVKVGMEAAPLAQAADPGPRPESRRQDVGGPAGRPSPAGIPTPTVPRITIPGQGSEAYTVAFSPDGAILAAAYANGTVVLWDPDGGRAKATLEGPLQVVSSLAFSPDGKMLASGTGYWKRRELDGEVDLWDVTNGKPLSRLKGHQGPVYCVAFAPDGRTVASAGIDEVPRLWDVATGQARGLLPKHSDWIFAIAYSPDGKAVATAGGDMVVRLSDPATGREKGALEGHRGQVEAVAFSPDGKTIATGGRDRLIKLWDADTLRERASLEGHAGWVTSLSFSPDGTRLAAAGLAGDGKEVKLWEVASGQALATLEQTDSHSVAYAPDGKSIATGDGFGHVKVWDVAGLIATASAGRPATVGDRAAENGRPRRQPDHLRKP